MMGPPADAPKATCSTCGTTYVDWEDFSGPAHPQRDCLFALVQRVSKLTTALQEINDEATNAYNWHCTRGMKVAKTPRLAPGIASWLKKLTDAALK